MSRLCLCIWGITPERLNFSKIREGRISQKVHPRASASGHQRVRLSFTPTCSYSCSKQAKLFFFFFSSERTHFSSALTSIAQTRSSQSWAWNNSVRQGIKKVVSGDIEYLRKLGQNWCSSRTHCPGHHHSLNQKCDVSKASTQTRVLAAELSESSHRLAEYLLRSAAGGVMRRQSKHLHSTDSILDTADAGEDSTLTPETNLPPS